MSTSSGAMLEAALRYAELGYPVFHCAPGQKLPLTQHGFLNATTDPAHIEGWWTVHPDANVAIATEGLVVVDVDGPENPWLSNAPERQLDLTRGPMALTPGGGTHRVFRQPPGKSWRCTEGKLAPKVDTRADGGYFVVAPSVTESKSYRWAPGLELDGPPESLPEPPPWLAAELDRLSQQISFAETATENPIPSGQRNGTLARLAGTMRRVGMSQTEMAVALLQVNADRCVPPLAPREVERIAVSVARYSPDEVAVALMENHWDQMHDDSPGEESTNNPDPGPTPERLLGVPGFIDQVMNYTLQTAPYPERTLAFGGALSLQAFLAGRKVRDMADNRTNLFVLGLANSGAGKDYPRKVNQKVLLEAGLTDCLGDSFASGEGIEDRLLVHPLEVIRLDNVIERCQVHRLHGRVRCGITRHENNRQFDTAPP
jgi:hypothetical protein